MEEKLNDQMLVRRDKLGKLKDMGIEPFGQAFKVEKHSKEIKEEYGDKTKEELEALNVKTTVAGRIMSKRRMGKLGFMHIQDRDGQIQIVVNKNVVGEDIQTQTHQVCKNIEAILKATGSDFEHVVKTTCFLHDMNDFAAFNEVYAKYFTGKPARSCVAVKALPKGVLCEVETIAAVKEA